MADKLNLGKTGFLFVGFCIVVFLVLSTLTVVWADPNGAYCVRMGYLYKTTPALNNEQGICQFPDGTWCDAHEFFKGNCSPAPYVSYRSSLVRQPTGASDMCWRYGGSTYYVHTIYGDVPLCVLPDGRTIHLPDYGGTSDAWSYYAYSWLNAP